MLDNSNRNGKIAKSTSPPPFGCQSSTISTRRFEKCITIKSYMLAFLILLTQYICTASNTYMEIYRRVECIYACNWFFKCETRRFRVCFGLCDAVQGCVLDSCAAGSLVLDAIRS